MRYTKEDLYREIHKRRPWYQSIDFPEYKMSTTDHIENALIDAAWDNKINDISLEEAARLRPKPKYKYLSQFMPDCRGMDVLEIGCNCGFFSFKFAEGGAKNVIGIDVAEKWLENAEFANSVLGYKNVEFHLCDFMLFNPLDIKKSALLSNNDKSIPLVDNQYDLVFTSTVIDHLFFPLFSIYKMCRISRKYVVIDVPVLSASDTEPSRSTLNIAPDGSHHGFAFTAEYLKTFLLRIGIEEKAISINRYNNDNSVAFVVDTTTMRDRLVGA